MKLARKSLRKLIQIAVNSVSILSIYIATSLEDDDERNMKKIFRCQRFWQMERWKSETWKRNFPTLGGAEQQQTLKWQNCDWLTPGMKCEAWYGEVIFCVSRWRKCFFINLHRAETSELCWKFLLIKHFGRNVWSAVFTWSEKLFHERWRGREAEI